MPDAPSEAGKEAVQNELDRVLASAAFANAERSRQLLRYLVSESLAGRGSQVKEYSIGVEVFGRPASFDPRTDSIVRTEANRLRVRLRQCYTDTPGKGLRIELPARTYEPLFPLQVAAGTRLMTLSAEPSCPQRRPRRERHLCPEGGCMR